MNRQQAIDFLINRPVDYAKMLGFDKLGSLHCSWIVDMVRGREDKTLQASRNTYKTTCVSIALALIIILLPNKRTLFMRKTDGDVKEVIRQVQKILLDPHTQYLVQCIYGVNLKLAVSSVTEVSTNLTTDMKGSSQLVGIGTGASITGKHFDFIFTDDIVNIQDRVSRAERDRTKLIYQELQNVKNRGGKIVNTGTPWHSEDAFSIMPTAERYDCYHPEIVKIISPEDLESIKSKMTPSLFAANYELKHIASENIIFTSPKLGAEELAIMGGWAQLDSAFYGEDFTALSIMTFHDGTFYLFGKLWRKHVQDCYDEIKSWYDHFQCQRLLNEKNADKGMVARDLRNLGMKVQTYNESMNKHIKIVTYLKAIWEDVVFVEGTDAAYIDQICDYNEDAEHDDAPDSAACLARVMYKKSKKKIYPSVLGLYDIEEGV